MRGGDDLTRREAIRALLCAMTCVGCGARTASNPQPKGKPMSTNRQPVVFLPHGGGPWPWMPRLADSYRTLSEYLRTLAGTLPEPASAVLMISAHWEAPKPTLMTAAKPPMLYDYYGFPPDTYEVKWPAPGAPELAGEVESLLSKAGFSADRDAARGFDHGTFVPMALSYPGADIPTLQLSLVDGLDPKEHLKLGRVLAPLRDQGVLIVGSGMSYHNMRGFQRFMQGGPAPTEDSKAFDDWMAEAVQSPADRREGLLAQWEEAPAARASHPREEHLLPLHVCAGAALDDAATLPYRDEIIGAHVSAVQFG
jgi:aromatic ring-opening dioxygenase catalytic subunit (LigB family)